MAMSATASFTIVFGSIRIIFGPFDVSNAFAFIFVLTSLYVLIALCFLEAIIYRILAAFCPKTIIGINDDWFHYFFNYSNIIMALIVSSIKGSVDLLSHFTKVKCDSWT